MGWYVVLRLEHGSGEAARKANDGGVYGGSG